MKRKRALLWGVTKDGRENVLFSKIREIEFYTKCY